LAAQEIDRVIGHRGALKICKAIGAWRYGSNDRSRLGRPSAWMSASPEPEYADCSEALAWRVFEAAEETGGGDE